MTVYATAVVDPGKVKFRWQEPYVSEAHNRSLAALPAGVYRGFELSQAAVPDTTILLKPAAVQLDSVLVAKAGAATAAAQEPAFKVFLRETADVVLATGALLPNGTGGTVTVYVVFVPLYTSGGATTAQYRVVDAAGLAAIAAATGYVLVGQADVPNGATTFLTSYVVAAAAGGKAKDRPWGRLAVDADDDSPSYGLLSPYLAKDLGVLRNFGLQDWYEGGFQGSRHGTTYAGIAKIGAGRTIVKTRGPVTVQENANLGIGAATYGANKPFGGFLADGESPGTVRPDWGFHGRTTKKGVPGAADHPRFVGLSLFDYAETGRGAITFLADPINVTLTGTADILPDGSQPSVIFGDPITFKSDVAPGDIVELLTTDNGNAGVGIYDVTLVSGSPARLTVVPRGQAFTSWGALGVTSATARIWKRCLSGGSTPGPTSGFSGGAVVRGDPSTTALRVHAGEGGNGIAVYGTPGASTGNYHQIKWRVTAAGDTISGGGVFVAGDLWTTAGNVVVSAGAVTVTGGDITAVTGDVVATAGDLVASAGNVTVTLGDVDVLAGDVNIDTGDLNVDDGNVLISTGFLSALGGGQINGLLVDGNLIVDTGDLDVLDGDLIVHLGDLRVDAGDLDVDGDALVGGNVTATTGYVRGRLRSRKFSPTPSTPASPYTFDLADGNFQSFTHDGGGAFTLNFANVLDGSHIVVLISHNLGFTLTWGTINGAGGTHKFESVGGTDQPFAGNGIDVWYGEATTSNFLLWRVARY